MASSSLIIPQYPSSYIYLSPQNGFVNYANGSPYQAFSVRKINQSICEVVGVLKNPNRPSSTAILIASLPAGYAPGRWLSVFQLCGDTPTSMELGRIDITPAGELLYFGGGTVTYFFMIFTYCL